MQSQAKMRVLLFDDGVLSDALRQDLDRSGFQLLPPTDDVQMGLHLLRESPEPIIAFFTVSLAAGTMTGLDQAAVLGELLQDEQLARRHAFILVTPTPLAVQLVFGRLLERIKVTTLAFPLDREPLLAATWMALQQIGSQDAVSLTAVANPLD